MPRRQQQEGVLQGVQARGGALRRRHPGAWCLGDIGYSRIGYDEIPEPSDGRGPIGYGAYSVINPNNNPVILQVLDARDPLACRCPDVERYIRSTNPNKRIVLLLNKMGEWRGPPAVWTQTGTD